MGTCRVLVIDVHAQVRQALKASLSRAGYGAVVGDTGSADEAVTLAATLQPDLILLEPKRLDALPLIHRLREAAPDSRIVVHTSYPDLVEEEMLLGAGASAYLLKALDVDALVSHLVDAASTPAGGSTDTPGDR